MEEKRKYLTKKGDKEVYQYVENTARYGQENCHEEFLRIASIDDPEERKKEIFKFIKSLEDNADQNGFFRHDEKISANFGIGDYAFKLNSRSLYTTFFDEYRKRRENKPDEPEIISHHIAILDTLTSYFGDFRGDTYLREQLLTPKNADEERINNNIEDIPSISVLKGKHCAMCAEHASIAHNLLIMGGYESSYITASHVDFGNGPEAHAFCIETQVPGKTYLLFDPAQEIFVSLKSKEHPRDMILGEKPLQIENKGQKIIYANSNKVNTKKAEVNTTEVEKAM